MKNTKVAFFALTAALALSPMAYGSPLPFSLTETDGGFTFKLTGEFNTSGAFNIITTDPAGLFTQTGTGGGDTTSSYVVLKPTHTPEMGAGIKNDNHYLATSVPFDASGLLIKLTSGKLVGDYVYINGISTLDAEQVDLTIFKSLTGAPYSSVVASVNYYLVPDITKTPEPSSLFLLGTGLLSLAGLVFWKSKSSANTLPALTL